MVAVWILAMPQVLLFIAAGAGLVLAGRRWYLRERARIAAELDAVNRTAEQQKLKPVVPLELDPLTGIYRPKHLH